MVKFLKKKIEKAGEPKQTTTNQTKMNHFFLSLLSEFEDMTDNQIRSFKIKVLQLIDGIKQGSQSSTSSTFIESSPSTLGDSFPSTSRESTSSSRESNYPLQQNVPQYSPISSVATPSQNYTNTPSPVHMPYDLSAYNNNTHDLSYEEL
uniref:BESS domain-containing protein n=2 Tax=Pectinophora gossypiella TaxID=13191 RepID=A0A1E1WBD1_PECGO